eukprot:CAMPEP_0198232120 /NCGR_PEP_ID=MMETSP1445-20131203/115561_1 /TAXON_ID=36898 /ORGANISM="Pyramimonas sp., Strain CCMP2087" /LENGTH=272 /DNA_ID=CAMNT_0043912771 /DNA_START=161 /DNA_END=979 /DNA_ORIENTATION=-
MSEEKPSFPEGYKPQKVWTYTEQEGKMGGMNKPTAGKRSDEPLPVGDHPIQLYSLGTPNGMKCTILLEELGVEYDAWYIDIFQLKQFTSGFVEMNPNSKIPCMSDNDFTPPLRVFESGHILKYLAEKYGKFIPEDPRERVECFNWLFWLQGSAPYIGGGFGHFYNYAPVKIEYAIDRFTLETKRLLDVLDKHLEGREWVCAEYSIADMAIMPWIMCIYKFYNAAEFIDYASYKNVVAWVKRVEERPAAARGLRVNGFGDTAVKERHSAKDFE